MPITQAVSAARPPRLHDLRVSFDRGGERVVIAVDGSRILVAGEPVPVGTQVWARFVLSALLSVVVMAEARAPLSGSAQSFRVTSHSWDVAHLAALAAATKLGREGN